MPAKRLFHWALFGHGGKQIPEEVSPAPVVSTGVTWKGRHMELSGNPLIIRAVAATGDNKMAAGIAGRGSQHL